MFNFFKNVFVPQGMLYSPMDAEEISAPDLSKCKRVDPPKGGGLLAGQKYDNSVNTDVRKTWKRYGWQPIHEKLDDTE